MRLKLLLSADRKKSILPINYQYPVSAWIYKVLNQADSQYATRLHEQGYKFENEQFKLFTFSQIFPSKYTLIGDRLKLLAPEAIIYLSFHIEKAVENFIVGLFQNQRFVISDSKSKAKFIVRTVESLSLPDFQTTMSFTCLSPMCVSKTVDKNGRRLPYYLSPLDEEYEAHFINNLVFKYFAAQPHDTLMKKKVSQTQDTRIQSLSEPKSRLVTVKSGTPEETRVRGYLFRFRITAPPELIRFGYEAGFGEKNSLGFGYVE